MEYLWTIGYYRLITLSNVAVGNPLRTEVFYGKIHSTWRIVFDDWRVSQPCLGVDDVAPHATSMPTTRFWNVLDPRFASWGAKKSNRCSQLMHHMID